jgi:hypothetical protein
MYEHWTVGNGAGAAPAATATRLTSFEYTNESPEEETYILFVHGWNMEQWEKERFAETAYKRLWHQGYKGRFGLSTWPCTNNFSGTGSAFWDSTNYDRGEFSAWRSAVPLRGLLSSLYSEYNGELHVFAHSMGNVVMGEALRLQSDAGGSMIVKTYVASQAAIPAHVYDSSLAGNLQWDYNHPDIPIGTQNYGPHTPNIYGNCLAFLGGSDGGSTQSVGRVVNFFNPNDWALAPDIWEFNQITKPDYYDLPHLLYSYYYGADPTGPVQDQFYKKDAATLLFRTDLHIGGRSDVQDRYEIMSFAAEARTSALGRTGNVSGGVGLVNNIDLTSPEIWPADPSPNQRNGTHGAHKWHSAQFRSTYMKQKNYWETLLGVDGFNIMPSSTP